MDKPPKARRLLKSLAGIFGIILISAALAYVMLSNATDLFGLGKPDQQIEVTIDKGMSANDIAQMLAESGVIRHPLTFLFYAQVHDSAAKFQAGAYILNSRMAYDEIIISLSTGSTIKNVVALTFYEGLSLREIAAMLEANQVCSAQEFIRCTEEEDFGFEFERMLPENEHRFRRLEGYLFPDTYEFYVGENVQSVVKKFLRNFAAKVDDEFYRRIQDAGYTLDQFITLASLIQEEGYTVEEMHKVSSVFHNRLTNSGAYPNLQSDVTIFYVENDIKPYLNLADQSMYDAYNTYVCTGLPVGPICNPGLAAIKRIPNTFSLLPTPIKNIIMPSPPRSITKMSAPPPA
jgi:UPF0755 protein